MDTLTKALIVASTVLAIAVIVLAGTLIETWHDRYNEGYKNGLGIGMNNRC